MEAKKTVYIIWGDDNTVMDKLFDYDPVKETFTDEDVDQVIEAFSFATEAELRAFMIGVEAASGYSDYYEASTIEHARERVRGIACEHVGAGDEDEEEDDD